MRCVRPLAGCGLLAILALLPGCAVPQPRGEGKLEKRTDPQSRRGYWLYLPKEYVAADDAARAARRWPLVVTFHGMKHFDGPRAQAREWEQEADRYGFIVLAPDLNAFVFFLGQFPFRTVNPAFRSDETATLSVMDHVFETTRADPNNVLATSWSSGGYMAHYMLNRHPDRFTCLGVRQSNFSATILDAGATSRSLYHPVLILTTQNDIGVCKQESQEAIRWYETHGYKNLAWVYINRLGHERTPDTAADFFARACGAHPNRPPGVLVQRQAIDGNANGLALLSGNLGALQKAPGAAPPLSGAAAQAPPSARPQTPRRPTLVAASPNSTATPATAELTVAKVPAAQSPARVTPPRPTALAAPAAALSPVAIRVSSAIGFEPLLLVFSAECPAEWHRTADFFWTLNGTKIAHGVNGQRTLSDPGDYTLELLVVTENGSEHRATRRIRVLKPVQGGPVPGALGP